MLFPADVSRVNALFQILHMNFYERNILNNLAFCPNIVLTAEHFVAFLIACPNNSYILKADFHVDNRLPLVSSN